MLSRFQLDMLLTSEKRWLEVMQNNVIASDCHNHISAAYSNKNWINLDDDSCGRIFLWRRFDYTCVTRV